MSWWATGTSPSVLSQSLHTVFCAECTSNFDWKSAGVYYTHRVSGMPGKITRLLACTDAQKAVYPKSGLEMGPTFVHPNYVNNPHNGESSGSYNKPASVMHWVREAQINETFVLFIDADMLLRAPIDPVALGVRKGLVVSEHVRYLDNGISRHLPENFLQLVGGDPSSARFAKAAGWYHIFHLDDLKAIAPRWLYYCEQIRTHPQLYWDMNGSKSTWHPLAQQATRGVNYLKTGDDYVKFGEAPWISEMYGYVVAAAEQLIDTKLLDGLVEYTDWTSAAMPPGGPTIIHYGLHCHVDSYHFTKYHYTNFDVGSCPLLFFRAPNTPKSSQALCAETINTLNDALCEFYRTRCPGAEELTCAAHVSDGKPICENSASDCHERPSVKNHQCSTKDAKECRQACTGCCGNTDPRCLEWAFGGECVKNPGFMKDACKLSCHQCDGDTTSPSAHRKPVEEAVWKKPEQAAVKDDEEEEEEKEKEEEDVFAHPPTPSPSPPIPIEKTKPHAVHKWEPRGQSAGHVSDVQLLAEVCGIGMVAVSLLALAVLSRRCGAPTKKARTPTRPAAYPV